MHLYLFYNIYIYANFILTLWLIRLTTTKQYELVILVLLPKLMQPDPAFPGHYRTQMYRVG